MNPSSPQNNEPIPAILHYFWIPKGGGLGPSRRLLECRQSMLRLHPQWTAYEWNLGGYALQLDHIGDDDPMDAYDQYPVAFEAKGLFEDPHFPRQSINVESFLDRMQQWTSTNPLEPVQADLLKLTALYLHGGFVVDYDIWGLRPLDRFRQDDLVFAEISPDFVGEALIAARPLDPRIRQILLTFVDTAMPENGICFANLSDYCHNRYPAYPTDYFIGSTREGGKFTITPNTHTVHLWSNHDYDLAELKRTAAELSPTLALK